MNQSIAKSFRGGRFRSLVALVVGVAGVVAAAPGWGAAAAPAFTPNHLFVGGADSTTSTAAIFEFDSGGNFVRKMQLDTGVSNDYIYGLTFGPDGNLYGAALSARRILRITPTLAVSTFIDSGAGMTGSCTGIEIGPQGRYYVCCRNSGGKLLVFNPDSSLASSYTAPGGLSPSFVTFAADGHVFLTLHAGGSSVVHELDSNLRLVRVLASGNITGYPGNWVFGRNGISYLPDYSGNRVRRFDSLGAPLTDLPITGQAGPYGLAFAPDGNLCVASWNAVSNQVLVVNPESGATVRVINHAELRNPTGLAFAPVRLAARLAGTINPNGAAQQRLSESPAVISLSPGSSRVMLSLSPTAASNNIAGAFPGTYSLVFDGNDASASTGTTYAAQGSCVAWSGPTRLTGSIAVVGKGSTNTNGFFTPKSVTGTLQLSRQGVVLNGTFSASSPPR